MTGLDDSAGAGHGSGEGSGAVQLEVICLEVDEKMNYIWTVVFLVVVVAWWSPRFRAFLRLAPAAIGLHGKRQLGSAAWDDGTVLQARIGFHVGDPSSADPVEVVVHMDGDMDYAPELLLWLAIRVIQDVDGLHRRSDQVGNIGVPEYVQLLDARATKEPASWNRTWSIFRRTLSLVETSSRAKDCEIVVNLVDGGRSGLRWLAMVHLQGSVGDLAQVMAPWLLWDHLSEVLQEDLLNEVNFYMHSLTEAPHFPVGSSIAAVWANQVFIEDEVEDANAPFLPFRRPCHCGADPTPTGIATSAILLGIPPPEFKARFGNLCADHINDPPEVKAVLARITEAHFAEAHEKGLAYVGAAASARDDEMIGFQRVDPRGIYETEYGSGRIVRHDPPLPVSRLDPHALVITSPKIEAAQEGPWFQKEVLRQAEATIAEIDAAVRSAAQDAEGAERLKSILMGVVPMSGIALGHVIRARTPEPERSALAPRTESSEAVVEFGESLRDCGLSPDQAAPFFAVFPWSKKQVRLDTWDCGYDDDLADWLGEVADRMPDKLGTEEVDRAVRLFSIEGPAKILFDPAWGSDQHLLQSYRWLGEGQGLPRPEEYLSDGVIEKLMLSGADQIPGLLDKLEDIRRQLNARTRADACRHLIANSPETDLRDACNRYLKTNAAFHKAADAIERGDAEPTSV